MATYDLENSGQFSEIHIDKEGGFCWKRSFHAPLPHVNHRELSILESLTLHAHPNVISLLHYEITDEEDDNLYIDFKFPHYNCSLLGWCSNSPTDEEKADCFIDLCSAVGHLHQVGVLHRDINPSNIMMNFTGEGRHRPVIIDFGVAWSPDNTEGEAQDQKVTQVATG